MRAIIAVSLFCMALFAGCAHQTAKGAKYVSLISSEGKRIAGVVPTTEPYTHNGPAATAWLPNQGARMVDGRIVNGIMIRSWSEAGAARVQVYGMLVKAGAPAEFTTDDAQLEPVELGSYLLRPNQTVPIAEMKELGVEPLMLRY
jgi:hypothetical protein